MSTSPRLKRDARKLLEANGLSTDIDEALRWLVFRMRSRGVPTDGHPFSTALRLAETLLEQKDEFEQHFWLPIVVEALDLDDPARWPDWKRKKWGK